MEPKKDLAQLVEALLATVSSVGPSETPFIILDLFKTFYHNLAAYAERKGVEWTRRFTRWENPSSLPIRSVFAWFAYFAVPTAFARLNFYRSRALRLVGMSDFLAAARRDRGERGIYSAAAVCCQRSGGTNPALPKNLGCAFALKFVKRPLYTPGFED